MTETRDGLSARAQRLAAMLAGWPRRRVGIADLWRLLDETDPTTRTDVRRRRIMAALIAELHGAGLIELPAARSYDHSETPSLPRFITLPQPATEGRQLKPVVWHPALSWVPEARITRSQAESLERVNHWLHNSRDPLVVPARERSLELFGDEKEIDHLVGTSIFGPGRLTMELLRCRRVSPPLHCQPCGSGDLLVVIENSDTFDSALSVLRERDDHRAGMVAWGAGTGFEASILSVGRISRRFVGILYFGDLDENGLRIPANAAALANGEGLPAVRPAIGLYTAMLRLATPQPGQRQLTADVATALACWLHPQHQEAAIRLLTRGDRLAQESVGLAHLSRNDEWLVDLV